jgi:P4 family phage/plasmid primase-like protien
MMTMTSQANTFDDYLKLFRCEQGKTSNFTHTRIGSKELNVYSGVYCIPDDKRNEFYDIYYDHIFTKKRQEYLTEKQLIENGPIMVDLDLHYDPTVDTRLHTRDHILDLIILYVEQISKLMKINEQVTIPVFVFEKPNVNMLDIKTKDGIHLIIGVKMHKALQVMLRDRVKEEIETMWDDLPIINTWDAVLDEGVTRGHCNWQLYGSRKPGHKAYELTGVYDMTYNTTLDEWEIEETKVSTYDVKKNFKLLSAQYADHVTFPINETIKYEYEQALDKFNKKTSSKATIKKNLKIKSDANAADDDLSSISSIEQIDRHLDNIFNEIRPIEYELKETHDFVMILPEKFYGPGSFDKWIRVGWALKNTSEKLFMSWVKFSSQSSEFSFDQIPNLYEMWKRFEYKTEDALTNRSIMYWAKNNSEKNKYDNVRSATIDYFINQTIQTSTEFDFASVLFNIFKDQFVCASIKGTLWYQYRGQKWEEIDSGSTLRLLISKDMHDIYVKKCSEAVLELHSLDQSDDRYENLKKKMNKITDICVLLKKTSWKNNIMREAQELFYDRDFLSKLDQNPYLLCCNNGVIDFKNKLFRKGQPDDYISMSTNIDYMQTVTGETNEGILNEINEFMRQLFPVEALRTYMWEHLASCLIGTNENQTFNIYTGSGANGKSKLVDLISKCLGDYKGTVPLPLITQKRTSIGSTSSEIVQLKGTRLAVMQEPSKGDQINEGIMKEITGGDPIQGRALFRDMVTFIPQFKLVVTTNTLFEIKSNDDGTWRRIRKCDFMSKFVDEPFQNELKFPREHYPYQYKIDKKLDTKFVEWAPIFLSKLVEIGYRTGGNVKDCQEVLSASEEYRNGQDYLSEFARDKIQKVLGRKIKKSELMETFKNWYIINYGRGVPKGKELYDFMDRRYGNYKGCWNNVSIIYDEDEGATTAGDIEEM